MVKYRIEIQNCISVQVEAENPEEARIKVIDNLKDYSDEMLNGDCLVGDAIEGVRNWLSNKTLRVMRKITQLKLWVSLKLIWIKIK